MKSSSENLRLDSSPNVEIEVEVGSGNVFLDLDLDLDLDLGLRDAEERQAKVRLSLRILATLEAQGLTQAQAAGLVGLKQPDICALRCALRCARLEGFSIEGLLRVLKRLGHIVSLQVSEETSEDARPLVLT